MKYYYCTISTNSYNVVSSSNTGGHRTHNPRFEGLSPSPATSFCNGFHNILVFEKSFLRTLLSEADNFD